jgi:hypothetical protein
VPTSVDGKLRDKRLNREFLATDRSAAGNGTLAQRIQGRAAAQRFGCVAGQVQLFDGNSIVPAGFSGHVRQQF